MKKLILVFVAIAIAAGAYAQADSTNRKMSPREDMNKNQNQNMQTYSVDDLHPDGVLMQNGKVMVVKNGKKTTLGHDMTMSNGTKISNDGNYTKKDGTTMTLKEGEHMDMSGKMNYNNTNRDRNMDFNRDMQNNPNDESYSDGVMMHNGKMMVVKNGKRTTLDRDMTMSNGTKISSDGNYTKKDGTTLKWKEGEHMDMSGKMNTMDRNRDRNMDFNQNRQNNHMDEIHPDGVMMQNGKMMMVKNGKRTTLDRDMTMTNGTKISSDGNYTKKDGTTLKWKEGEHMDMSGNMNTKKTDKDRNMYLVPDSTRKKNY